MSEYIDKRMLLSNIADNQYANATEANQPEYHFWKRVWDYIQDAPPAVVDPVKHVGRWLYSSTENPEYKICPNCGTSFRTDINIKLNYCPDCGNSPMEDER